MYRVVISPSANADLFNALKYITYDLENPQAATKLADGVEACYAALSEFPASHELCRTRFLPAWAIGAVPSATTSSYSA